MGFTENKGRPELEEGFPPNSPSSPSVEGNAEKERGRDLGGRVLGRHSLLGHLSSPGWQVHGLPTITASPLCH